MRYATQMENLLLDILRKNQQVDRVAVESLLPGEWEELYVLASEQRVAPLVWHRLKQKQLDYPVPRDMAALFQAALRQNTLRNLGLNAQVCHLISVLDARNIPVIFLKGIALANAVYESIGLREMNDLDLLVSPGHLRVVAEMLKDMGYRPMNDICPEASGPEGHHLPGFLRQGCAKIEVHWNIANAGKPYSIDPDPLWQRAVPLDIGGVRALSLSREDLLLHLCLHASYPHQFYFGLRPSCDIAEVIDRFGEKMDWDAIIDRARSWRWGRGVYLSLYLARELLDAAVPEKVLGALRPADLPDGLIESSCRQIFTERRLASGVTQPFADFVTSRSLTDKMKILWRRIFLTRDDLALKYSVPSDSLKIYAFYPRRLFDVMGRHKHNYKKILDDDPDMKSFIQRKQILVEWMEQGDAGGGSLKLKVES